MIKNKIIYLAVAVFYTCPVQADEWNVFSYSEVNQLKHWAEDFKINTHKQNFNIIIANDNTISEATNNILYHSKIDQSEQWIDTNKVESKISELSNAQSMATIFMPLTKKDSLCAINTKKLDSQILNKEYQNSISEFDNTRISAIRDIKLNSVIGEDIQKFIFNHEIGHCLIADRHIEQFKTVKNVDLFLAFPKLSHSEIENIHTIISDIAKNNILIENEITEQVKRYTIYINENYADAYALVYGKEFYQNIHTLTPFIANIRLTDGIQQGNQSDHDTNQLISLFNKEYINNPNKSTFIIDELVKRSTLSFKEFITFNNSNKQSITTQQYISNTLLDNSNKQLTVLK